MAEVSMAGKGQLTQNTAYKISNLKNKKKSLIKRLWYILNLPIRVRLRS